MSPTLTALTGFVAWSLFLLVLMEIIRSKLVITKAVPANGFDPGNSDLSPFMQRLARAHANCVEGLPILGDCWWWRRFRKDRGHGSAGLHVSGARLAQSLVHLTSVSSTAVIVRFSAFSVQMAVGVYWACRLLL